MVFKRFFIFQPKLLITPGFFSIFTNKIYIWPSRSNRLLKLPGRPCLEADVEQQLTNLRFPRDDSKTIDVGGRSLSPHCPCGLIRPNIPHASPVDTVCSLMKKKLARVYATKGSTSRYNSCGTNLLRQSFPGEIQDDSISLCGGRPSRQANLKGLT